MKDDIGAKKNFYISLIAGLFAVGLLTAVESLLEIIKGLGIPIPDLWIKPLIVLATGILILYFLRDYARIIISK